MNWLEKAKVFLGVLDPEDIESGNTGPLSRSDRPSLDHIEVPSQQGLEDALRAREAGDLDHMRKLLREMDRGGGLRTVIRAAAALEAGDESELTELLPVVCQYKPSWKLLLQVAAALDDEERAQTFQARAQLSDPPSWVTAWCQLGGSEEATRHALVDLLFTDAGLARTVAARELGVEGVDIDATSLARFTSFAHGRDCIKVFGAEIVADLLDRAAQE